MLIIPARRQVLRPCWIALMLLGAKFTEENLSALEVNLFPEAGAPSTSTHQQAPHLAREGLHRDSTAAELHLPPDSLRVLAQHACAREDWTEAVALLERLEKLEPGDYAVEKKLNEARAHLQIAQIGVAHVEVESAGKRFLLVAGALAALIALPAVGVLALASMNRARFHLLRGNYKRAAQLYENLLLRHPGRLKIYPRLANVYLLMGRQDETALRVFKTIMQLNLATPQRQRINDVLAGSYIAQGRADQEAIAVLESALQEELRRQKQV